MDDAESDAIEAGAEEVTLRVLPDTDHFLLWTRPELVRRTLLEAAR